ncbi:RnfH family protein [Aeromonas sp. sif2416]|uniref:RnfH family protein n=1 Tax=Aeromonas sp. sif2416 TaxID=2854793 RepID=UPI001C4946CF|nr:RnfH family protein [Aeromonas sp. sif2416]
MSDLLNIEVAYALPERQTVLRIRVAPGTNVLAAIEQSGIVQKHPEIDLAVNKFGIYSRPVKGTEPVQDGDRVEIYRPLLADPKEMRKKRAEKAKEEGRADVVTGGRPDVHRKRDDGEST